MKSLQYKLLSGSEKELVLAARPKELRKLDEDELIDLHTKARKARNKYAGLHRRRASGQVRKDRARGKAAKKHARVAAKAEVFEEVLARVSQHLSVAARFNSEALKAERLSAARRKGGKEAKGAKDAKGAKQGKAAASKAKRKRTSGSEIAPDRRSRQRRSIEKRRVASQRAAKRRHEARRR